MEIILDVLKNIRPEEDFSTSTDYIEGGLLDSFDVVTLVSELDRIFKVSIDGVDIVPENFKNMNAIISLLRKNGVSI
jgi:acyl carrier protein